jgi:hypothetical protein
MSHILFFISLPFGGNGLSIDYDIGRFFTDAEALISYEGTTQMQNLILTKAITRLCLCVAPQRENQNRQYIEDTIYEFNTNT